MILKKFVLTSISLFTLGLIGMSGITVHADDLEPVLDLNSNYVIETVIPTDDIIITPRGSTTTKNVLISSKKVSKQWIGYHSQTPNWSKASSYTLSSGKTYTASGSYNYDGITVGLSYSKSFGASTTIPANALKYSKLGVWADITFSKYKTTSYDNYTGKAIKSWNTATASYQNFYIQPKYQ